MSLATGTVYQRKSDGRWVAAVMVAGKRVIRYADTERQARQRLRELVGKQERGILSPPTRTTLTEWADRWLTTIEPDRRPATMATYRYALRPIQDNIGGKRLDRLTPDLLAQVITALRQQHQTSKGPGQMGSRRIHQNYRVLKTCLSTCG